MTDVAVDRLIIIVRAEIVAAADAVALVAAPETSPTGNFSVRLCTAPAPPMGSEPPLVALGCSWAMSAEMRDRLLSEFGRSFARTLAAIPRGGRVRRNDLFWIFEAEDEVMGKVGWTFGEAISALGMAHYPDFIE